MFNEPTVKAVPTLEIAQKEQQYYDGRLFKSNPKTRKTAKMHLGGIMGQPSNSQAEGH
jgi:hypothetical protein